VIYTCVRSYGKSHHDGPVNTTVQNWKPVLNELMTVYGVHIELRQRR
jgi:hypothetical protein